MKKIFAVISILLASVYSFAQELTFRSVCDGLAKNRTTKGEFIQEKTIGKTGRVLKSKGKFIFCREGILWSTEKPFPSTLVVCQDYMVRVSSDGTRKTLESQHLLWLLFSFQDFMAHIFSHRLVGFTLFIYLFIFCLLKAIPMA